MDTKEVRALISKAPSKNWFNTLSVVIQYKKIRFSQVFKGVSAYHKFLTDQVNGWQDFGSDIPSQLSPSQQYFRRLKTALEAFLNSRKDVDEAALNSLWPRESGNPQADQSYFTSDCSETIFLVSLQKIHPNAVSGAHSFLVESPEFNGYDNVLGSLLAYEFKRAELPKFSHRKLAEGESIRGLINKFNSQISESETELSKHQSDAVSKSEEFAKSIDALKESKDDLFAEWFEATKSEFSAFDESSKQKIVDLETQYKENLKLKEPAQHWEDLSKKYSSQGWWSFALFFVFTLVVIFLLREILWKTPDQLYTSFYGEDKSAAIRWSIIFVTFISFMAYCIRSISKVMFSAFHLSRDCQERHTLTYFYLSLLNESEINTDERQLVMQSLFSRADTGLLKDDGSPAMPNDFVGKVLGKK
ncbi:MAG: hypothetical protein ACI9SP_004663 [Arenicella sp.]|jgi:hypothetical protein